MTEFVATALLVALLALCVRPPTDRPVAVWSVAALAVLVTAIRMHYAPAAAILLGLFFLRSGRKLPLVLAVAALVAAVGVFDAVTWNGGLFHSYGVNIAYNLVAGGSRAGESPPWQFLWWLALAGAGLNLLLIGVSIGARTPPVKPVQRGRPRHPVDGPPRRAPAGALVSEGRPEVARRPGAVLRCQRPATHHRRGTVRCPDPRSRAYPCRDRCQRRADHQDASGAQASRVRGVHGDNADACHSGQPHSLLGMPGRWEVGVSPSAHQRLRIRPPSSRW